MVSRRAVLTTAVAVLGGGVMANAEGQSARAAGFHMPLESEPHLRTFMQWPALKAIYGSQDDLDAVREKIALIANTIAQFEPVVLLARADQLEDAKDFLKAGVEVWPLDVQDLWCRDSGPSFVVNASGEIGRAHV